MTLGMVVPASALATFEFVVEIAAVGGNGPGFRHGQAMITLEAQSAAFEVNFLEMFFSSRNERTSLYLQ